MAEDALLRRWDEEMRDIHAQARAIGYNATRFFAMLTRDGGLGTAKALIAATRPSDGFTELWNRRRLDLSVEARALQPEFASLFTAAELARCRKLLRDYRWTQEPPWTAPGS